MKEELKNKEQACESVKNRYITRVKETLIASNPEKYVREVDGYGCRNVSIFDVMYMYLNTPYIDNNTVICMSFC